MEDILTHPIPGTITIQLAVNVTPEVLKDPEMLAHAAERAGRFWHEAAKRRAVQYGLLQE